MLFTALEIRDSGCLMCNVIAMDIVKIHKLLSIDVKNIDSRDSQPLVSAQIMIFKSIN